MKDDLCPFGERPSTPINTANVFPAAVGGTLLVSPEFPSTPKFHAALFTLEKGFARVLRRHMNPQLLVLRKGCEAVWPLALKWFALGVQFFVAG